MIRVESQSGETTRGDVGGNALAVAQLASGRVDAALALFLEAAMLLRSAGDVNTGAAIEGALLEREAPVAMKADALEIALADIDDEEAPASQRPDRTPTYAELIVLPVELQRAVARAEAGRGWKAVGRGIQQLSLKIADSSAGVELLRIAPGAATPRHTHIGRELTLCLSGGFSDGRGSYGPGDISVADPSVRHQPRADEDGPCFVLAVTDADLKFEGVLGLMQKLFSR